MANITELEESKLYHAESTDLIYRINACALEFYNGDAQPTTDGLQKGWVSDVPFETWMIGADAFEEYKDNKVDELAQLIRSYGWPVPAGGGDIITSAMLDSYIGRYKDFLLQVADHEGEAVDVVISAFEEVMGCHVTTVGDLESIYRDMNVDSIFVKSDRLMGMTTKYITINICGVEYTMFTTI